MKTTILIKENRTQLVLEYENDHDENVLNLLEKLPNTYRSEFIDCQGGWTMGNSGKKDLIIVFDAEDK